MESVLSAMRPALDSPIHSPIRARAQPPCWVISFNLPPGPRLSSDALPQRYGQFTAQPKCNGDKGQIGKNSKSCALLSCDHLLGSVSWDGVWARYSLRALCPLFLVGGCWLSSWKRCLVQFPVVLPSSLNWTKQKTSLFEETFSPNLRVLSRW